MRASSSILLPLVAAATVAYGSVSCGTSGGSGPSAGSDAGSSSDGGHGSCSNGTACGGNMVGAWAVTSSCLTVSGQFDLSKDGFGTTGMACSAPVSGSLQVTGTWTANSDQTYTDGTTTSGSEQFTLSAPCLSYSSTPIDCAGASDVLMGLLGFDTLQCTASGSGCDCSGTVSAQGGLGLQTAGGTTSGAYTVSGDTFTAPMGGTSAYSYCVSGSTMTVTPQSTGPTVTGTITLSRSGSSTSSRSSTTSGSGSTAGSSTTSSSNNSSTASSSTTGSSTGSSGPTSGPCDIYASDPSGTVHCVAAHSTVRALVGSYSGKLYQVRNAAGMTKDVPTVGPGGVADSSVQDAFCSGTSCVITVIYDQTGNGNDVTYEGPNSPVGGGPGMQPCDATKESITVSGKKVYSLYYDGPGHGYWADGSKKGMPLGAAPQGIYMVTSGTHTNNICCFDYGNGETNRAYAYPGAMDAVNFSQIRTWGTGAGTGPWVMADLEAGLYSHGGGGSNANDPSLTSNFVTAVEKNNGTTEFALRGSDATSGSLSTFYKGALPSGYNPMRKQGSIVVGSGGDCCATNQNLGYGTFYEGCIVAGYPSDATEDAVQANIVAAKYAK